MSRYNKYFRCFSHSPHIFKIICGVFKHQKTSGRNIISESFLRLQGICIRLSQVYYVYFSRRICFKQHQLSAVSAVIGCNHSYCRSCGFYSISINFKFLFTFHMFPLVVFVYNVKIQCFCFGYICTYYICRNKTVLIIGTAAYDFIENI